MTEHCSAAKVFDDDNQQELVLELTGVAGSPDPSRVVGMLGACAFDATWRRERTGWYVSLSIENGRMEFFVRS